MDEYTVKIKDYNQDIIHTVKQIAYSKNQANKIVMDLLRQMLGHDDLQIV